MLAHLTTADVVVSFAELREANGTIGLAALAFFAVAYLLHKAGR